MATLHIAFRYGDTRFFSRLVCLLRGGDSAHVEAAEPMDDGRWRCTSSSGLDGGVRQKDMPLPPEKWRIYKTDVSPEAASLWMASNKGEGYGWSKLVRFAAPFLRPSWGGPICTEAVAQIMSLGHSDSWDLRTLEAATAWRYERTQ